MKIGLLLGTMLPLVLLPACGGDAPKNDPKPSVNAGAADQAGGSSGSSSAAADEQGAQAQQPQEQEPKRIRRPKINDQMVKALFGRDPNAPAATVESTAELVALGDALYHAEQLSVNSNQSCASCHDLKNYGVDNKPTSEGSAGKNGDRNSPTTYNAARQFAQFWDGRAASVEEQAIIPVLNEIEHGLADEAEVIAKIKAQPALLEGFQKAFPNDADPVTIKNFGAAVGAFERTLVTRSRWDDYLDGNSKALTNLELLGLKKFMDHTCTQCHMMRTLGGHMLQKVGSMKPYPSEDTGRMRVTGNVADKNMFKVPMLLNVEKTAPYYHDGKIATLEEAVANMAEIQLGKTLPKDDVDAIVAFLKATTGELPAKYRKQD